MSKLTSVAVVAAGGFAIGLKTKFVLPDELAAANIRFLQSVPGRPKTKGPQPDIVEGAMKAVTPFMLKAGTVFDVDLSSLDAGEAKKLEPVAAAKPNTGGAA